MRVRTLLIIAGSALVYGQFPPGDMATGNHGSCIGQNKYPVQTQHPKHQAIRLKLSATTTQKETEFSCKETLYNNYSLLFKRQCFLEYAFLTLFLI